MATGILGTRMLFDDMLNSGNRGIAFCEKVIARQGDDRELSGFPLLCAKQLVSFHYFKEIRKSLLDGIRAQGM